MGFSQQLFAAMISDKVFYSVKIAISHANTVEVMSVFFVVTGLEVFYPSVQSGRQEGGTIWDNDTSYLLSMCTQGTCLSPS